MFEELPPERSLAQTLVADLADDLPDRVERLKLLLALDADFADLGVMLPGGHAAFLAYTEVRASFVNGYFMSTVLLSQTLVEHILGGNLVLNDVSREVRSIPPRQAKPLGVRPQLKQLLDHAIEAGILDQKDALSIRELMDLRNPLMHFRGVDDVSNIDRRAMATGLHPMKLIADDARHAINVVIRLVGKMQAVIGGVSRG